MRSPVFLAHYAERAHTTKLLVELGVVALLLYLYRRFPRVGLAPLLVAGLLLVLEYSHAPRIECSRDGRRVLISRRKVPGWYGGLWGKMNLAWGVCITFAIQVYNGLFDGTFYASKSLASAMVMLGPERAFLETAMDEFVPDRYIILTQHTPGMVDTLGFLNFVPETHTVRTINDFTGGGSMSDTTDRLFQAVVCRHLYGASKLTRRDKRAMEAELAAFAGEMVSPRTPPTVFAIWPSGRGWRPEFPNGVEKFKCGAFLLSAYARIPVAVVHTRANPGGSTVVSQQSRLYRPPKEIRGGPGEPYAQFLGRVSFERVRQWALEIERVYRVIDDRCAAYLEHPHREYRPLSV